MNRKQIEKYAQLHDQNFWYLIPKFNLDSYTNQNGKTVAPLSAIKNGIIKIIEKNYDVKKTRDLVTVESLEKYNLYYAYSLKIILNNPKSKGLNIALDPMEFWNEVLLLLNMAFKSSENINFIINKSWTSSFQTECVFSVPHIEEKTSYIKVSKEKIKRFFSLMDKIENGKLNRYRFSNRNVINIDEFLNDIYKLAKELDNLDNLEEEEDDDLDGDIFYNYHLNRPDVKLFTGEYGEDKATDVLNYKKLEALAEEEIGEILEIVESFKNIFSSGKAIDNSGSNPFVKEFIVFEPTEMNMIHPKKNRTRPSLKKDEFKN